MADQVTRTDGHIPIECNGECDKPYGCMFCAGDLFGCSRCYGLEGSMPSECPGELMTRDQRTAIFEGEINFRNGRWLDEPSRHSPKGITLAVEQDV